MCNFLFHILSPDSQEGVKYSPGSLKALKTGATTGFALSLLTLCDKNAINTPTALAGNRYVGYCQTEVQTLKEDVSPGEKPWGPREILVLVSGNTVAYKHWQLCRIDFMLFRSNPKECFCIMGACKNQRWECHDSKDCKEMKKCKGKRCVCEGILFWPESFHIFLFLLFSGPTCEIRKEGRKSGS